MLTFFWYKNIKMQQTLVTPVLNCQKKSQFLAFLLSWPIYA